MRNPVFSAWEKLVPFLVGHFQLFWGGKECRGNNYITTDEEKTTKEFFQTYESIIDNFNIVGLKLFDK